MRKITEEVEALVSRAGKDPIWGYTHCKRVYALARSLAKAEDVGYDDEILRLASLLHDIGLYRAYNLREGRDHVQRSASVASRLLRDRNFPPESIQIVLDAIEHHPPGYPSGRSVEAALLKDAVALDYLGSIGLARVFAMVGLEEDVPDLEAAFRHAKNLRYQLPPLLIFRASRDIARERCLEMDKFFSSLRQSMPEQGFT